MGMAFFLWCTCTFLEPSWKNTAPYISRDILNSVFCYLVALGFLHHHFPNLPYTKTLRSVQQKDIPKRKTLKDGSKVLVINHALILTSSVLTSDKWFQILTDKINIMFFRSPETCFALNIHTMLTKSCFDLNILTDKWQIEKITNFNRQKMFWFQHPW